MDGKGLDCYMVNGRCKEKKKGFTGMAQINREYESGERKQEKGEKVS